MDWHSLFVRADDATDVVTTLVAALTERGYQRFDPFPGGSGTPLGIKDTLRFFVAPSADGWVRILCAAQNALTPPTVTLPVPHLHGWLVADASGWDVYANGVIDPGGLAAYLKPNVSPDALTTLAERTILSAGGATEPTRTTPNATLPADVQQLARERGVNPDQANKLINRLTAQVFGKLDKQSGGEASAMQEQAQAALSKAMSGSPTVAWESTAGKRLIALASALTLPVNWRDPDVESLREAYQVARRLQRNPRADLMADERRALSAVPNVIDYHAVYAGK
jgi:pyruvate/2-oxoglutarate dehydrogenase complex dihydrolipoamide acyltransferase (E2) component